jgi:FolB domain-containing protein
MILQLNSLAVDCIIGELPEERVRLQTLVLDVELEITDTASVSDELADTVDYAELAGNIRAALVEAKCKMIERAARIAADVCLEDGRVRSVKVKVTKTGAIKGLESASAVLTLARAEVEA